MGGPMRAPFPGCASPGAAFPVARRPRLRRPELGWAPAVLSTPGEGEAELPAPALVPVVSR